MTANSSHKNASASNTIFDFTPFPMWIYDVRNLAFLAVNQEAIRQYGYTKAEFLKMTLNDISPLEEIPKSEEANEKVLSRTEVHKESLVKHQKKDKSIIYVQIKSNPIIFEGKQAGILTAIDLTDSYTHQKHIKEETQFLCTIEKLNKILLKPKDWTTALTQCLQLVGSSLAIPRIHFFYTNHGGTIPERLSWTPFTNVSSGENSDPDNISFSQFPELMQALTKGKPYQSVVADLPSSSIKDILTAQHLTSILILPIMVNNKFSGFVRVDEFRRARKWEENEFQLLRNLISKLSYILKEEHIHQQLVASEARFKSLVQNGTDLIAILDTSGNYKYVAPTSLKVLGVPSNAFIGKNAFDFIYKGDRERVKKQLEQIFKTDKLSIEPYRFQDAKKNWQWIQTILTNHLTDPAIKGIVANSREVTAEVEKRMGEKLLASLTKRISQPGSLAQSLSFALEKIVQLSDICISEVWLISEDKTCLNLISTSCQTKKFNDFYRQSCKVNSFKKGKGLPGHVWKTQKNCIWQKLPENNKFIRSQVAKSANLNTALGVPIIYNKEFLGCLVCFSQDQTLSDKLTLLTEVGLHMGAVVMQKITEEHYRNFFDISPDPKCILGFDGYLKKINHAFKNLFEYDRNELMAKPIHDFLYPADIAVYQKKYNRLCKKKPLSLLKHGF